MTTKRNIIDKAHEIGLQAVCWGDGDKVGVTLDPDSGWYAIPAEEFKGLTDKMVERELRKIKADLASRISNFIYF